MLDKTEGILIVALDYILPDKRMSYQCRQTKEQPINSIKVQSTKTEARSSVGKETAWGGIIQNWGFEMSQFVASSQVSCFCRYWWRRSFECSGKIPISLSYIVRWDDQESLPTQEVHPSTFHDRSWLEWCIHKNCLLDVTAGFSKGLEITLTWMLVNPQQFWLLTSLDASSPFTISLVLK